MPIFEGTSEDLLLLIHEGRLWQDVDRVPDRIVLYDADDPARPFVQGAPVSTQPTASLRLAEGILRKIISSETASDGVTWGDVGMTDEEAEYYNRLADDELADLHAALAEARAEWRRKYPEDAAESDRRRAEAQASHERRKAADEYQRRMYGTR